MGISRYITNTYVDCLGGVLAIPAGTANVGPADSGPGWLKLDHRRIRARKILTANPERKVYFRRASPAWAVLTPAICVKAPRPVLSRT